MQQDAKAALLSDIDEALDNLGPNRPSAPKVTRARTLLKGRRRWIDPRKTTWTYARHSARDWTDVAWLHISILP